MILYQKKGNQEDKSQLANRQHEFKFLQRLAPSLFAAFSFCLLSSLLQAIDVQRGASLFNRACIGCHDAGGNILQPGGTLFLKDLQRNGIDTEEEIYRKTYYGKEECQGLERCVHQGVNAHLELVYRKMK
ncbi:hypothetical protein R6Q59_007806 [Mikania micrantha]